MQVRVLPRAPRCKLLPKLNWMSGRFLPGRLGVQIPPGAPNFPPPPATGLSTEADTKASKFAATATENCMLALVYQLKHRPFTPKKSGRHRYARPLNKREFKSRPRCQLAARYAPAPASGPGICPAKAECGDSTSPGGAKLVT